MQKHSRQGTRLSTYKPHDVTAFKQMEVVEWLRWYRFAVNDIVSNKKVVVGTGYFDELERDFYSAIKAAYYGPVIDSMDLLPDRFEAEERSVYETPEVLHLVSGRDLFGMVCLVNKLPKLSFSSNEKLASFASMGSGVRPTFEDMSIHMKSDNVDDFGTPLMQSQNVTDHTSDAYKDLELHIFGRLVAVATRLPPKSYCDGVKNEDAQDQIHVFLSSHEDPSMHISEGSSIDQFPCGAVGSRIPLGTITGLGAGPEEGSCFVYDSSGTKTHVLMKHRTLLVKHMHWFGVGEEVSVCECRCSRARLPPSKFWLFEPRSAMHDIGGWYVETFGRDKRGHTVLSQRYWDGFDAGEEFDKRLHPAMYLFSLAYRTLDLEDAQRRKSMVRDAVEGQLYRILSWCKKIV
ncbi:hypothetical protein ACB098_02G155100 [Castanea mollissima]